MCSVSLIIGGVRPLPCAVRIGPARTVGKSDTVALGFRNAQRGSHGRPGSPFWIQGGSFEVSVKAISPRVTFPAASWASKEMAVRPAMSATSSRNSHSRSKGRGILLPTSRKRTMRLWSDRTPFTRARCCGNSASTSTASRFSSGPWRSTHFPMSSKILRIVREHSEVAHPRF
jgi:hypothetical protein